MWALSLQWMLATVNRQLCNIKPLNDTERNIPDCLTHYTKLSRWRISHAHWRKRQVFGPPQTDFPKGQRYTSCKRCSVINPQQILDQVHNQHLPLIQRPRTRSLRGILETTLDIILLRVGGIFYNQYTITPQLNLGIPLHKVHQLATTLQCHAIKSLR